MQIGEVKETVEVTAVSPTIDTTNTTIGANLDSVTLSRLPVGRRFSDTLYLAPGVTTGGNVGTANPSIEGSSGLENQYVVDGVNITNGGYGALGSYSIVFGSLGNGTPYDFMQEVQVKTGGYEAEFGQATGGVINVVTKSGSNALKGSAFGYSRPHALESDYQTVQSVEGTVNTVASRLSDAGITVGGPVLRNRLFFFGAIDPQWETNTFVAPPGFPLEALGSVDRDRRITNYAAKGTWQLTRAHRLDASFFGDPATGEPIGEHMATTFDCVKESDPVGIVVDAMDAKNIRFVVVVDEQGKLAGLTGQKGLMEYVAEQFHREVGAHRIDAIQSHPFASVVPTICIAEAVRKLVDEKIACLLVEEEGRLIGVFSDRDVLDKVALEFERVKDCPISDVMNRNPVYVYDISSAAAAMTVMSVCGYRHVPVVNLQEKLVGIVSPQRVMRFLKQYYGSAWPNEKSFKEVPHEHYQHL
jgi:CBS domain-containing protein